FMRTARYDATIAGFLEFYLSPNEAVTPDTTSNSGTGDISLTDTVRIDLVKVTDLRYGENPHQRAALYTAGEQNGVACAEQLHGKEMSFNNYVDADAAWALVWDFEQLAVAIIK